MTHHLWLKNRDSWWLYEMWSHHGNQHTSLLFQLLTIRVCYESPNSVTYTPKKHDKHIDCEETWAKKEQLLQSLLHFVLVINFAIAKLRIHGGIYTAFF